MTWIGGLICIVGQNKDFCMISIGTEDRFFKGSLTLAMGKCLCFSVKINVCQSPLSSP